MSAMAWCSAEHGASGDWKMGNGEPVNVLRGLSSTTSTVTASAAICLTASPRSQQELRLKPTTSGAQNQREQLARVQIVVLIVPLETVAVKSVLGR